MYNLIGFIHCIILTSLSSSFSITYSDFKYESIQEFEGPHSLGLQSH